MLENRFFGHEIGYFLKNTVDKNARSNLLFVHEMHKVVLAFYGNKINKMMNLQLDPKGKRLIKKSGEKTATRRETVFDILAENRTKKAQRHLKRLQTAKANQAGGKKNRRTLKRSRK
jgi:hypothetical protein